MTGTGEPGATVTLRYGAPEETLTAVVDPQGNWTIAPVDIPHETVVTATQVDPAGNTSGPATETVDSVIGVPTIDPVESNDPSPILTGSAEAGATVVIAVGGATFEVEANASGEWELNTETATPVEESLAFTPLTDGQHEVAATATDAAGNSASDTTSNEIMTDLTPPEVTIDPLMTGLKTVVTGTAEIGGGEVSIYDAEDNLLGTAPVDGDGIWTFTPETPMDDGTELTASQTDAVGNTGSATENLASDVDGDGVANTVDIDDDNDGILDTAELGNPVGLDLSGLQGSIVTFDQNFGISESQATGVTQNLADVDLGDRMISVAATFVQDVGAEPHQGGDSNGNLLLGGRINDAIDPDAPPEHPQAEAGDHVRFNLGEPLVVQFSHETSPHGVFDPANGYSGDELRLEADGGFSFYDPDGQLNIETNADGVLVFTLAEVISEEDATWSITTNAPVETFDVYGNASNNSVINIAVIDSDTNNDGIIDSFDTDSDNGGTSDNAEAQYDQTYIAPLLDDDGNPVDEDGDGLNDAYDENLDDAEGSIGLVPADTDGDGTADLHQTDANGDDVLPITLNPLVTGLATSISGTGVPGATIALTDANGDLIPLVDTNGDLIDPSEVTVDENGEWSAIPATPVEEGAEVTATQTSAPHAPAETASATETLALDTDGDMVANTVDIDDDNDGILDVNEIVNETVFETNFGNGAGAVRGTGSSLGGWEVTAGNVDHWDNRIDLTGFTPGTIAQTIETIPGETYVLSFDYSANLGGGGTTSSFNVNAIDVGSSTEVASELFASSTGTLAPGTFTFVAPGTSTLLEFETEDLASSTGGNWLSNIALVQSRTDIDGDGIINSLDTDSDNGGASDNAEVQYGQTFVPPSGNDEDGDGLDDAYDDTPNGGAAGSVGLTPVDIDGNGTADAYDFDAAAGELPITLNPLVTGLNTVVSGTGIPGATITLEDENGDPIPLVDDNGDPLDPSEVTVDANGAWSATPATPLEEGAEVTASISGLTEPAELVGLTGTTTETLALDTDGDMVANTVDIDDDGDGILDVVESGSLDVTALSGSASGKTLTYGEGITANTVTFSGPGGNISDDGRVNFTERGPGRSLNNPRTFTFENPVSNVQLEFDNLLGDRHGNFTVTYEDGSVQSGLTVSRLSGDLSVQNGGTEVRGNSGVSGANQQGEGILEFTNLNSDLGIVSVSVSQLSAASANKSLGATLIVRASDPIDAWDADRDGTPNHLDTDSDDAGLSDNAEAQYDQAYIAPLLDGDGNPVDVDGDGLNDAYDDDLNGAAGSVGLTPADTNGDGLADAYDEGTGTDALPVAIDMVEAPHTKITGTGVVGATITLSDGLGEAVVGADGTWSVTLDDPITEGTEVTATQSDAAHAPGATSTATMDIVYDSDGDGVADTVDIDDDNDGIIDTNESATLFANEYGGTFGALEGADRVRDLENPVDGYTFTATNNGEGQYAVVDAAGADAFHGSLFGHLEDRSGDPDAAFLVVNGGTSQGNFFSETVTLTANTDYDFGFSAANGYAGGGNPFEIGMRITDSNGNLVQEFSPGELVDSAWVQSSSEFNTGSETEFTIELYNISTGASGNDFAVDNIFVRPIGSAPNNDVDNDGIINSLDTDSDNGGSS